MAHQAHIPIAHRPTSGHPQWALEVAETYLNQQLITLDQWPDSAWAARVVPLAALLATIAEVAKS